jgi:hypothetical protein
MHQDSENNGDPMVVERVETRQGFLNGMITIGRQDFARMPDS